MKRFSRNGQNVVRGLPSAVGLSILIHAAFFLLAGMLVVFTVARKEGQKFIPPKVTERPRMKLRKPKVTVKKTSKPRPPSRIVAKTGRAGMPVIQLPELDGMVVDLEGLASGFDLEPNFGEAGLFGNGQTIGNDFEGTFYDFLKDRSGRRIPMDWSMLREILEDFVANGWRAADLVRYYRSPRKLYATTCMFPCMESVLARIAFGEFEEGSEANDYCWAIHYKGQLVHKEGIRFRFWGMGDSILTVRVDGEIVLDAPLFASTGGLVPSWHSSSSDSHRYYLGNGQSVVGDWITLEPGIPLKMEYLVVDAGGGAFGATLLVELEGEEYETNRQGGPILPVFKTAPLSENLQDAILQYLVSGEASLEGGPVFCDYDPRYPAKGNQEEDDATLTEASAGDGSRIWTMLDGHTLEARFMTVVANQVVLENARGKQQKIPLHQLSEEDRRLAELERPPRFNIEFSKKVSQRSVPPSILLGWQQPKLFDYVFTVALKQTSAGIYSHPLRVEYFSVGKEIGGNGYILLDRGDAVFSTDRENKKSFEFHGGKVLVRDSVFYKERRGEKYVSYLVTITDERGKIIQHATPNKWLFENIETLKKLPVGKYMDKACIRIHPTQPKPFKY